MFIPSCLWAIFISFTRQYFAIVFAKPRHSPPWFYKIRKEGITSQNLSMYIERSINNIIPFQLKEIIQIEQKVLHQLSLYQKLPYFFLFLLFLIDFLVSGWRSLKNCQHLYNICCCCKSTFNLRAINQGRTTKKAFIRVQLNGETWLP